MNQEMRKGCEKWLCVNDVLMTDACLLVWRTSCLAHPEACSQSVLLLVSAFFRTPEICDIFVNSVIVICLSVDIGVCAVMGMSMCACLVCVGMCGA